MDPGVEVTGTVIKASRNQIVILVQFDGDESPSAYRHDDVINRIEDMTDMLDGRGVRVGMRVESLPEGRLRLTGEVLAAEPYADPAPARGLDSPERFMAHAKSRSAAGKADAWLLANGFLTPHGGAVLPLDPNDLEELL